MSRHCRVARDTMVRNALLACLLLSAGAFAIAAETADDPVPRALSEARERRAPVLVDFTAPWCYSCYYMAKNVLTGPEWEQAGREAVVVELDADSPIGTRYKEQWRVKAMPTYLLLDAEGRELGRILGEQTRADFYGWFKATAGRGNALDDLKDDVTDGSRASVEAAREVLRAYHARFDAAGGLAWQAALPVTVQEALARDAAATAWTARLRLQQAAAGGDAAACVAAAGPVLGAELGCERPYELDKVLACSRERPAAERAALLRPQVKPMQTLVEHKVLAKPRCADERSIVLVTADLHEALGDAAAEKQVLGRAIVDARKRIAGDLRKDRNLADNLRVYLERAGRQAELDALLVKLIAAYPEDYVYAYRHGRNLAARGQHAQALPLFEQAAAKAYGVNKLRNAELRARSLQALGRAGDARRVLAEALQANGPWFPEDAAKLRALMQQLPPATT
jgi:thiol-disulfide isomerase/thioredoxin